jgi:hypothetical protein
MISTTLVLAIIVTIVLIVLLQKGALMEYAWIGWLVIFCLWLLYLFQLLGPRVFG